MSYNILVHEKYSLRNEADWVQRKMWVRVLARS